MATLVALATISADSRGWYLSVQPDGAFHASRGRGVPKLESAVFW